MNQRNYGNLKEVSELQPCELCKNTKECSSNRYVYICKEIFVEQVPEIVDVGGMPYYIYKNVKNWH